MMMNTTLDQLRQLKLVSMAQALQEQMQQSGISAMSFEERLALLVDREVHGRQDRRCAKLLKTARLKYPQAMIEDLDCRPSRGIDRATVMSLTLGPWVRSGHAVLITGPTGAGKSWLGCALAQHACRQGHSAFYQRVPRLAEELRIRHANGTFTRWLDVLKNTDVLVLDDWGLVGMDAHTRTDLLEMIDDRAGRKATIITSQLPIEHWHEWIGDATVADAMLDRIMQNNHRLTLTGESLRKTKRVNKGRKTGAKNGSPLKSKRATPASVTITGIGGHVRRNTQFCASPGKHTRSPGADRMQQPAKNSSKVSVNSPYKPSAPGYTHGRKSACKKRPSNGALAQSVRAMES